jgi:hypothetical protein
LVGSSSFPPDCGQVAPGMPSSRDSFRRNRVAPLRAILALSRAQELGDVGARPANPCRVRCKKRSKDSFSLSPDLDHNRFAERLPFYPLPNVGQLTAEVSSTSATAPSTLF